VFTIKRKTCSRPTVTREDLAEETLGLANRIAQLDPYSLMMAKRLVNEAMTCRASLARQKMRSSNYALRTASEGGRHVR
jgi:enoyl-CoA hydratase/carnithine racemase